MGLRRALSRLLPAKPRAETPTTSIYFAVPMAPDIGQVDEGARIERLEPNVFVQGNRMVVMRHWSAVTRRALSARPDLELIYFIDDDLWAVEGGSALPKAYQARLVRLRTEFEQQLRPRVKMVVSPSAQILARFPKLETLKLDPAMIYPPASLDHHEEAGGQVRVVFCATASHLADLSMISRPLVRVLRTHPNLHLTTFLGNQVPKELQLDNCRHLAPQSWEDYQRTLTRARFHIGLAPLKATAFNTARSATRVLDHAAVGAAGLYSNVHPFTSVVSSGENGVLVKVHPEGWEKAIRQLIGDPAECRRLAAAGQRTALQIGEQERVRTFWRQVLEA